mgnify:CR=1 FL=1
MIKENITDGLLLILGMVVLCGTLIWAMYTQEQTEITGSETPRTADPH